MEPSLQPSFTFPSRKVYANLPAGLQSVINLQQITSRPKQATDINTETSLYTPLTVPRTLDKDSINWPAVLPVASPWYVQPGTAEGLTAMAQSQQYQLSYEKLTSGNNCLKRGNYKAAEYVIGRELTPEEIANRTITPNVRVSESGQAVHVGNHGQAVGTNLNNGSSTHAKSMQVKLASRQFLSDLTQQLAPHFGWTPDEAEKEVQKLKTRFGNVGDLDFSEYGSTANPQTRKDILDLYIGDILKQKQQTEEQDRYQRSIRGAEQQMLQWDKWRAQQDVRDRAEVAAEQKAKSEPQAMRDELPPAQARERAERKEKKEQERKANEPPAFDSEYEEKGQRVPHFTIPGGAQPIEIENLDPSEIESDVRGPSLNPGAELLDPTVSNVAMPVSNIQEDVFARDNMEMEPDANADEVARRVAVMQGANAYMEDDLAANEAPAVRDSGEANMSDEKVAEVVLNAPVGERVPVPMPAPSNNARLKQITDTYGFGSKEYRAAYREELLKQGGKGLSGGKVTKGKLLDKIKREAGGGLYAKHGRHKVVKHHPYRDNDNWVPDADGYYPYGAPVSGELMRRTGANAIPISAQLQVSNTHQFTEVPVRTFASFPNMTEQTKTPFIPIAQSTDRAPLGVGLSRRSGKVPFGAYMLDHGKLTGEGVLSLSHPSGRKVKGLPNMKVSDRVLDTLSKIVKGKYVTLKNHTEDEKAIITHVLKRAKAKVPKLGADVNMPPDKQLQLVLGEMSAGNDSKELKGQLRKLLPYMEKTGQLTKAHIADIRHHYL